MYKIFRMSWLIILFLFLIPPFGSSNSIFIDLERDLSYSNSLNTKNTNIFDSLDDICQNAENINCPIISDSAPLVSYSIPSFNDPKQQTVGHCLNCLSEKANITENAFRNISSNNSNETLKDTEQAKEPLPSIKKISASKRKRPFKSKANPTNKKDKKDRSRSNVEYLTGCSCIHKLRVVSHTLA